MRARSGKVEDGEKVYVVVCQPYSQPDGPAQLIGPYSCLEFCYIDLWWNAPPKGNCDNRHVVGWDTWPVTDLVNRGKNYWADPGLDCWFEEWVETGMPMWKDRPIDPTTVELMASKFERARHGVEAG